MHKTQEQLLTENAILSEKYKEVLAEIDSLKGIASHAHTIRM